MHALWECRASQRALPPARSISSLTMLKFPRAQECPLASNNNPTKLYTVTEKRAYVPSALGSYLVV